ncbi:hypothetical protein ACEPAF_31 [Sanghuangporus sanghuang]
MTDSPNQKAKLSIDIIIVGASISGLACAYALREAGHNVLILEAGKLPEGLAVIHCPPNMTRILFEWGIGPDILAQTSGRCPKIEFHSAYTQEKIGELIFHKKVMDELGAEMYSVHKHADLVRSLYKLAASAGAQINFGSRVISVDNETATVTLGSGKTLKADLIVGADGHQSIVRAGLEPTRKEKLDINYTTYLFTIPASRFKDDQEIPRLLGDARWYMWMGFGWGMSMFGIRNNTVLSCTLFMNEEDVDVSVDWKSQVPVKDLGTEKLGLTPMLNRILSKADSATRVKVDREDVPEYWYDSSGRVIVVGEAAHASLVGTVHSAALGIEDAAVLGRLLSKLKSKHEIKRFLSAFHEIRHPRSERLSASEQQKVDFITLPAGALSEARDESMRLQMNEGQGDWSASEDSFLTRSWEEFRDAFGYDAFDEADTWWVEWGVLLDRINGSDKSVEDDIFSGQITVERERHACTPSI